ncbi:MAG TPA: hypothetical protein VFG45_01080 [Candidatus Nitrosocosmicus sp.]|jgi:hypothetical protein|nr:hypothetical protein [Candidatus Nitrosocosmicus sp.]
MAPNNNNKNDNRVLASADAETKERVARAGGEVPHEKRGLQAAEEESRKRIAREGRKAYLSLTMDTLFSSYTMKPFINNILVRVLLFE